jgi:diguanylate cyclase (GGDEF)-like protein
MQPNLTELHAGELSARGWSSAREPAQKSSATDVARVLPWCAEAARRETGAPFAAIVLHRPVWDDMEVVVCAAADERRRVALVGLTDTREAWESAYAHASPRPGSGIHVLGRAELAGLAVGRAFASFERDAELAAVTIGERGEGLGLLLVGPAGDLDLGAAAVALLGDIAECVRVLVSVVRTAGHELSRATMLEELLLTETRLTEELPMRTMLELWCRTVSRVTAFQNVFLGILGQGPEREGFRYRYAVGWRGRDDPGYGALTRDVLSQLLDRRFIREGCALVPFEAVKEIVPDAIEEAFLNASGPFAWNNHWLLVPLYGPAGDLVGVARLDDPVDLLVPGEEQLRALRLFANHLTQAMALQSSRRRLSRLAATDPLTRLPNRRAFEARLGAELALSVRHGRTCALVSVDFDGLKAINDSQGHAAGDAALVELARTLRRTMRAEDSAFRTGGDEFALLLPGAGVEDASELVARIRAHLRARTTDVSASFGIAVGPVDADDAAGLLKAADDAMYRDKNRHHR